MWIFGNEIRDFFFGEDAYSKWPDVRAMPTTTVPHTIEMMQDILAIHGFPQILVSDNGPQKELGIRHSRSVPYHPATNGLAENMVKNVKQWLSKQSCGVALYEFLHAYRNAHGRVACSNPIWMCTSY